MEHRRAAVTLAVDERDLVALREWAQERYGSIERYAEIIRTAIVGELRRARRLTREVPTDERQRLLVQSADAPFAVLPLIGWKVRR